jgi:hypothetical protein
MLPPVDKSKGKAAGNFKEDVPVSGHAKDFALAVREV